MGLGDSLAAGLCLSLAEGATGSIMIDLYAWVSLNSIIVAVLVGAVHFVLRRWSKPFVALGPEQGLVTTFHASAALLYTGMLVPMTLYGMRLVFPPSDSEQATAERFESDFLPAFILVTLNSMYYASECATRTVIKPNWMLVLHHSVRNAMVIMGFLKRDIFTLKHGVVYDTFAMYEVALFATLAARRLQVAQRAVVAIWWFGMGLYAVTRVIQTVFLVWLFAVGYGEMSGCGKVAMWWANLVLFLVITTVQAYTFPIYLGVLKRSAAAVKRAVSRVSASMKQASRRLSMSQSKGAQSQRETDIAGAAASQPAVAKEGSEGDTNKGGSVGGRDLESAASASASASAGKSLDSLP